ncbi:hypothetical protein [Streptomyces sp. B1I3]|uniref:DUF6924 domain-containing protein n=1 Tax=Streptomyces sp. B1I3 TaxID=3042264 RepID=UPI00358FEA4A
MRRPRAEGEDYQQLAEFGREFRPVPAGVDDVHANLSVRNLGFEEYAACGHGDPEGVPPVSVCRQATA